MRRIGTTSSGNIVVEMTPGEWLSTSKKVSADQSLPSMQRLLSLIKQYREENGLTQVEFAHRTGVSRNTISKLELGMPGTLNTAEKIMAAVTGKWPQQDRRRTR